MNYLDKLRKKDPDQQDSFVFFVSFGVTLFIFLIWLLTMLYGFQSGENKNTASPIQIFSDKAKSIIDGKETYNAE